MRSVINSAREILEVFPRSLDLTPEQNRALASLRASIDNVDTSESISAIELAEAITRIELWQSNEEQQAYGQEIAKLRDELEQLQRKVDGL